MKAKYKAKILEAIKDQYGQTVLSLQATDGKVETRLQNAQHTSLTGRIVLRDAIAADIKIGATITITVSDEEPNEGSL